MIGRVAGALAVSTLIVSIIFFVGRGPGWNLFDRLTRTFNPIVVWTIYAAAVGAMMAWLMH